MQIKPWKKIKKGKSTGLKMNQRSPTEQKKASQQRTDISVLCPEGTRETQDRRLAVHSWAPEVIFQINGKLVQQG